MISQSASFLFLFPTKSFVLLRCYCLNGFLRFNETSPNCILLPSYFSLVIYLILFNQTKSHLWFVGNCCCNDSAKEHSRQGASRGVRGPRWRRENVELQEVTRWPGAAMDEFLWTEKKNVTVHHVARSITSTEDLLPIGGALASDVESVWFIY